MSSVHLSKDGKDRDWADWGWVILLGVCGSAYIVLFVFAILKVATTS